ncbi:acyl-CoA dehydrogenase family protein [Streptomyces sp. PT12]|uniref:acyl-CoA dehydrogenase family protein n=1 Tax=Streptomyces sp. PT12 TaxID=1510197 RepID=UPI000DE38760|nr:acyl-CoA dehydrogenase family protein [Streptomyces sp. PT12]RBM20471.1 acyl-CoA dehydrogenase [Streptomyces sp. PT12]
MIELDDRLRAIRDRHREAAEDLRSRALAIDADPEAMEAHLDSPAYLMIRESSMPPAYRTSATAAASPDRGSCLENIVGLVELFRGDVAALLACPSPALAGVFVELLGDAAQKERFYRRIADGRTWSFFAMTEAGRGNDATAMETRLERDGSGGWLLHGAKRYIGHGARGGVGVVFGRTGRSALSIRAALVELPLPGWHAERLDMVGLRGAFLSELRFDGLPVAGDMLLGEHLPVTRRGIWGALTTFNNMRMQIAAAAVGTALAMAEYVAEHRKGAPGADLVAARAQAARHLVYEAAARLDRSPERGYLSSAAKLGATKMAVATAHWAAAALGPAGLLEHPLLEKWTRDVRAFEFMDGTGNIQRLHVARGYRSGDADA